MLTGLLGLSVSMHPAFIPFSQAADSATKVDTPLAGANDKPALAVSTTLAKEETWNIDIEANGVISPWQEALVSAEIGGLRVTEVLVDVGSEVKRGQPLIRLEQETVKAEIAQQEAVIAQAKAGIAQAEAAVAQAEASVKQAEAGVVQAQSGVTQAAANAKQAEDGLVQGNAEIARANAGIGQAQATYGEARANADRARRLKPTGALPMQQIDQYLAAEASAQAGVQGQQAGLAAQKAAFNALKSGLQARQAEIRAQQAAVVAQQAATGTQTAAVDVQKAALAAQKSALEVQQAALESQKIRLRQTVILAADDGVISARTVALGAVVQVGAELLRIIRENRLEWQAAVASSELGKVQEQQATSVTLPTGEVIEGEVRMITPLLDTNTRNATVLVNLPSGSSARGGMFVKGLIHSGSTTALTLPQTAVILRDGRHYVFTVSTDQHVSQLKVSIGRRLGDRVEILEGLVADSPVVATGGAFLNDGDLVDVLAAADSGEVNSTVNSTVKGGKP